MLLQATAPAVSACNILINKRLAEPLCNLNVSAVALLLCLCGILVPHTAKKPRAAAKQTQRGA